MSEGAPISVPAETDWNIPALEAALGPATPLTDAEFGPGYLFTIPEAGDHTLAVFPNRHVVHVQTHQSAVIFFDAPPPKTSGDQTVFQDDRPKGARHLSLTGSGEVAVLFAPHLPEVHQGGFDVDAHEAGYLLSLTWLEAPPQDEFGFDEAEYARLYRERFGVEPGTSAPPAGS